MQKADSSVDFPSACDSAWEQLLALTGKTLAAETRFTPVDVDLEAAGIAGNRQWGLDAGHHQDGWSLCPSWSDDARHGRDHKVEPGPGYIDLKKADDTPSPRQVQVVEQKRPKPRRSRKTKKEP
ncbi:hypothetical protein BDZ89DRAFT_1073506 [Hymenopellis radicata]|nr:hypothetical protein BDZ89DRAFT_1073506 [Hymenopellis radicata]